MMDSDEFRRTLGHFASGVTIVASRTSSGAACGLTVNAFCSLSLEPMLVLVCVERDAESHDCIRESGIFGVSVLDADTGESLSRHFANLRGGDKFSGVPHRREATGAPILDAALAWIDCRVQAEHEGGDHTIFVGEVVAGDAREGRPLIYYRGGYGRLEP